MATLGKGMGWGPVSIGKPVLHFDLWTLETGQITGQWLGLGSRLGITRPAQQLARPGFHTKYVLPGARLNLILTPILAVVA